MKTIHHLTRTQSSARRGYRHVSFPLADVLNDVFTAVSYRTPWCFLGPVATLTDSNGHFDSISLRYRAKATQEWSKAHLIFPTTSHLLKMGRCDGHHKMGRWKMGITSKLHHTPYSPDLNPIWSIAFYQFWMPGPVSWPTKSLRL